MSKQSMLLRAQSTEHRAQKANCALFAYTSKYRYSEPFDDGALLPRLLPNGFSCFEGRCFV